MKPNPSLPRLYVEGQNDCRVICALVNELGTDLNEKHGPVIVEPKGSCLELLNTVNVTFKSAQSFGNPVGYVFDWDRPEDNRRFQLQERFKALGCELTDSDFTEGGIIKEVDGITVGVWLMPNAAALAGKLENFLREMIPASDPIFPKSKAYVDDVESSVSPDSRFRDIDREKADLHSWLAVQRNPGESYALAITSQLFSVDSPGARSFYSWFCRLYGLGECGAARC